MTFLMMGPNEPLSMVHAPERASWIENHAGPYGFQRKRAQILNVAYKNQRRTNAGVKTNNRVEGIAERVWLRDPANRPGKLEVFVIVFCAFMFPIAWPLGRKLYVWLTRRITGKPEAPLLTIPIATLMWIGAALLTFFTVLCGLVGPILGEFSVLQEVSSLTVVLFGPWLIVQGAGTFLMAGIYGYLEGWLAIAGSTDWWPEPTPPITGNPSRAAGNTPLAERGTPGPPIQPAPRVLRQPRPSQRQHHRR